MSDENKVTEAEANTEEQPAAETPTGEDAPVQEESAAENAPQAVADTDGKSDAEAPTEPEAEVVAEPVAEAATDSAGPESDAGGSQQEQTAPTFNRVEGPAIFNRAKQGNQRRNPRHVGNDVRIDEIDYKNVQVLSRFVDNYGRIHNRRKTRVTAKMQRKVTRAIKRARHLALMPYTGEHIRITGRRG
ncbi:MAG: 30S ribosomal protein S18 [Caldilineaceae bacterium SB0661_bin_32]|uniref:Small ribosomal subunit protein bS18 n=1 Tax=Caldilineaceae bacterium SB0661_bin_32 TaxID=2605255 RepID=A0A6B1DA43_9CHLR|nr:30S ribosomal protein S18 [Caldilineaceae bacterium SB0661_bin_32]